MKDDVIYRQQAIDAIGAILPVEPMKNEYTQGITCGAALAIEYVKQLPSAQPERKKGKWITVQGRLGNEVECNQCHSVFWYWMANYRFCAHCGADMRGDGDND